MGKPIFNPYGMDPGFRALYDPYQIGETTSRINCPKCGTEIVFGNSKCPECGEKIVWETACSEQDRKKMKRKTRIKGLLFAGCIVLMIVAWWFFIARY